MSSDQIIGAAEAQAPGLSLRTGRHRVTAASADGRVCPTASFRGFTRAAATDKVEPFPARLKIGVAFASKGRGGILRHAVETLTEQTRQPDAIVLSCTSLEDAGDAAKGSVELLLGPPGLARQRNAALHHLAGRCDLIVFFDDDFLPHPRWLEVVEQTFRDQPNVAAVTGHVLADGVKGPGLTLESARDYLAAWSGPRGPAVVENYSSYGCNMAFRATAIRGLEFDERLVLYGWLEDRDFAGALAKRGGRLVQLGAAAGVHLGVKQGRVSGRRLGYSQIANPVYMRIKGTMTTRSLADHVFRNVVSNIVGCFWQEPYIDRRGRLAGNIIAVKDLMLGRLLPEHAETL